ncbi:MAG: YifB family Mg chelatase-like AAA ATPase [Bacteroidales bacterium]
MLCKVFCACCKGLDPLTITVEVDVCDGISFFLVGLPDIAVKESQQRISSALGRYGYRIPGKRIVVNLAPANVKKEGSAFDVAIAMGIISASGQATFPNPEDFLILGELALDGSLRPVTGALPIILHARDCGFKGCILPAESAVEGAEIEGITVFAAESVKDVIDILKEPELAADKVVQYVGEGVGTGILCEGTGVLTGVVPADKGGALRVTVPGEKYVCDFADVKGQQPVKAGLEIAAAGGHNVIMVGSPGSGKTFMAKCVRSILPPMSTQEAIETSKIYSVAGLFPAGGGLIRERPFRQPHHTSTIQSLAGSGVYGLPGEISLAHNGVLFLDEFAEFSRSALEILRQPLEDRVIQICRARTRFSYPASFMLVAAMNPCPCGYLYDQRVQCTCSSSAVMKYASKISGPLMDRIDIQLNVAPVLAQDLLGDTASVEEPSCVIAARVAKARAVQLKRYAGEGFYSNAQIPPSLLQKYCKIGAEQKNYLMRIVSQLNISARGYSRILKISRTIADLDGDDFISLRHISKAIQFKLKINEDD